MLPGLCSSLRCYIHFFFFLFFFFCRAGGRVLGLLCTRQTLSHTSPAHFTADCSFSSVCTQYCLHLGQPHTGSMISWLAGVWRCLRARCSLARTFLCRRLFAVRTRGPPLTSAESCSQAEAVVKGLHQGCSQSLMV